MEDSKNDPKFDAAKINAAVVSTLNQHDNGAQNPGGLQPPQSQVSVGGAAKGGTIMPRGLEIK
ncbi:MAG: hypothetical protein V4735_03985 [Pseudomonadota bacterium]